MPGKITSLTIYRVIDANYNRAKEGLRVCEDVFRFVKDDKALTVKIKKVRHGLTAAVSLLGLKGIVAARDIVRDVGRASIKAETSRGGVADIFYANSQRVKESLRVLEEFAKLENARAAAAIKKLRYTVYDIEKIALKRV